MTMNSRVVLREVDTCRPQVFVLAFPSCANWRKGRISVLTTAELRQARREIAAREGIEAQLPKQQEILQRIFNNAPVPLGRETLNSTPRLNRRNNHGGPHGPTRRSRGTLKTDANSL